MNKIIPFIIAAFLATPALASPFGDVTKDCPKVNGVCVSGQFMKRLSKESNIPIAKAGRYSGWGHRPWHRPHYNSGEAVVGGIIGGMLGNWLFRPKPEVVVVESPPPAPAPSGTIVIDPWTPEWYDYCANKYQSFDAKTGYYVGFDGQKHFCQ